MLSRIFSNPAAPAASAPALGVSSEMSGSDIQDYYLRIITECLRRLLVPADSLEVRVKRASSPDGRAGYAGCIRVLRWDPVVTPVLLQNMPVLDARVRKLVNASIILENTYYAGIWFQASSTAEGAPQGLIGLPAELVHQSGWSGS